MAYNLDPSEHSVQLSGTTLNGASIQSSEFSPASFEHLKFIKQEIKQNKTVDEPNREFPV